jgi:hypothetical protein
MTDKTKKTSERKNGRPKKGWLKNYVLICVIFLATVTMSTFFIRSLYMSIHIEEVTKEASMMDVFDLTGLTKYLI